MSKSNIGQGNVHEEYYMSKPREWNVLIGDGDIIYEGWLKGEPFEYDPKLEVASVRELLPSDYISSCAAGDEEMIERRKVQCKKCHGEGYGECMCYTPEDSDEVISAELKAQKPSDEGLEEAAKSYWLDLPMNEDDAYTITQIQEAFKAGAFYQAPISRAEGWKEVIDFLTSPHTPMASLVRKEGIRLGILKE